MCDEAIKIKWIKVHPAAVVPKFVHIGDAGADFTAIENVTIKAGERSLLRTGLKVEIPHGYEIQVRPRSGLSLKTPLIVANAPGTIDSSFKAECCVVMWNAGVEPYEIKAGTRIAQAVACKLPNVEHIEATEKEMTDSARGQGGFGSTGGH